MRIVLAVYLAALLLGACGGDANPGPTATGDAETEISISVENNAFSRSQIRVSAGAHVLIHFTNHDAAPHNLAFYKTDAAEEEIYVGETIRGPDKTVEYEFDAPEVRGTYFFRCDVHPVVTTGELIVE